MQAIIILLVIFTIIIGTMIFYATRSRHNETEERFKQGNVAVNYKSGTISLGSKTFPLSTIRSVRWLSGLGDKGNISEAYIETSDMKYPQHKMTFIIPGDAEKFITRLKLAIEKAGGPTFD